ncbi:MAG: beta-ketoacyl-[acyl-carrier-protein] synthase family protein [Nitrospirae bacterium]|nr:beta-ketoacyl-[acyl-carrier-protein] synthase family protein [Nitrospirota bacterium]MCL5238521.1 beta-ketoacyl-[acyl-carrier-protein] synthase family protein [Nitrospirota bacterium]
MRRVAVTGLGIISPVGNNKEDFFNNLASGVSGIKKISSAFSHRLSVQVAAEAAFNPQDFFSVKQARNFDRTTQMSLVAATQAWDDSGITLSDEAKGRAGVYMGTGLGGAQAIDDVYDQLYREGASRVSPLSITRIMCNAPASHISIRYGLSGPCLTYSTACASSSVAIGEAFRQIKAGFADIILAGGAESLLTYGSLKCWESLGVLALEDAEPSASCKPFSKDRTGFVIGEGAAVVVLEEMERAMGRGAHIYGELIGYGSTGDAHHITGPTVNGQARAMHLALEEARISSDEIDYINAHGTATIANDVAETQAIKKVFGERAYGIPISATKSMHGHLMGAAGAAEFITAVLAAENDALPPTANLMIPDPECDLDYIPNKGRAGHNIRTVMSNSFAFGGTNAVLVARKI